tara:strand:- start:23200 stop:23433 length:234 start_codon:yes stop_codon:yes gene_type:complete
MIGKKPWFKPKRKWMGWGIYPASWQGWLYMLVAVIVPIIFACTITNPSIKATLIFIWLLLIVIDGILIMKSFNKSDR